MMGNTNESLIVKTSAGDFYLEGNARGLVRFEFLLGRKNIASTKKILSPRLKQASKKLLKYLSGKKVNLSALSFDLSGFSQAERRVLRTLAKVPQGKVVTYQELARASGFPKASRFVGSVMRKNRIPIFLPCHRVVRSDGGLGGYTPGLHWKIFLLRLEACPWVSQLPKSVLSK